MATTRRPSSVPVRTSSCITTVSCPSGMTAPVKMRAAVLGEGALASGWPAAARPSTVRLGTRRRVVVAGGEGKAVDGGIGVGRHRPRRDGSLRQDAPGGLDQRHALDAHHAPHAFLQDGERSIVPQALLVMREAVVEELGCQDGHDCGI